MISILLLALLSQTGVCKTGTPCNASQYASNGQTFASLPACPGIKQSTTKWCNDCRGGDGGTGAWVVCGSAGWFVQSSSSGGGISPCTVSANGDLYCPGDGGFTKGIEIQQTGGSIFPDLQGLVIRNPTFAGWQEVMNGNKLTFAVGNGSVVTGGVILTLDNSNGNVAFSDIGFTTGTYDNGLIANYSKSLAYKNRDVMAGQGQWCAYYDGQNAGPVNFGAARFDNIVTGIRAQVITTTAGTGAGNYTVAWKDLTAGTTLCTRTIACATAVGGTPNGSACAASTNAANDDVVMEYDGGGCASNPHFNICYGYR